MEYDCSQKLGSFSDIFRSEARTALLLLFFLNPDDEYYIRGLEKTLGISAGNVRREILKLEKDNIIVLRQLGNIKLYCVNKKNPLYSELKKIVLYSVGVPKLLSPMFADENFKVAFIYGSYAKDEMDFASDIDLFVITIKDLNTDEYEKLNQKLSEMENRIGREINLDVHSEKEINEDNAYLDDVISGKKVFIKGGENELRLLSGEKTKD